MERSILFYFLLGAGVVLVPALTDRLFKGRVTDWVRVLIGFLAAALTGLVIVLMARQIDL